MPTYADSSMLKWLIRFEMTDNRNLFKDQNREMAQEGNLGRFLLEWNERAEKHS